MADNIGMNLGALRSSMELTLHTRHAARIWEGRAATNERVGIIGLGTFVAIMAKIRRGAEQDDPYSDWWMLRIEGKLDEAKLRLQELREQADQLLADIPPALTIGENFNVHPVKVPLFVNAQLGFLAIYLLAQFDEFVRRVLLAQHIALIDRAATGYWINEGARLLRSAFAMAQRYRFSGTTRDDHAANNAAARAARAKYGQPPQDVLEGTRRSRFAPPVVRRSALAEFTPPATPSAIAPESEPLQEDLGDVTSDLIDLAEASTPQ
jgi:integrating conjugative element protein (TIGR03761 family)